MTTPTTFQSVKCYYLRYHGGSNAEAIVRLEDGKPTGVMCTSCSEGLCKSLAEGYHERDYEQGSHLYTQIQIKLAEEKGIKRNWFTGRITQDKADELDEEVMKRLNLERVIKLARVRKTGRCIFLRGFQEVNSQEVK